mmetsp:Transcript_42062/g.90881  ORF Transcript_42062/g.90881 Transcript_42062/m.90881 type:complete len:186 (+) Transcript_42062:95-652(+)
MLKLLRPIGSSQLLGWPLSVPLKASRGLSFATALAEAGPAETGGGVASEVDNFEEAVPPHVQRLAQKLQKCSPAELKLIQDACHARLVPLPQDHRGPAKKNYQPKMPARTRDQQPLAMRSKLAEVAERIAMIHPAALFAGSGPGILPVQMPPLGPTIFMATQGNEGKSGTENSSEKSGENEAKKP